MGHGFSLTLNYTIFCPDSPAIRLCLPFDWIFLLYSLCCGMPAGTVGPLTAQASGSGTHVAAGIQSAAFSLDLSQRQRAAHQSLTLETRS